MATGRKPMPVSVVKKHISKEEKRDREEVAKNLATTSHLSCPRDLSPEARKEWKRLMGLYKQMPTQILSDLDRSSLVQYCEAWAVYVDARRIWKNCQEGFTAELRSADDDGEARITCTYDDVVGIMNRQSAVMSRLAEQLCLTPVSRARMGMNSAKRGKKNRTDLLDDDKD